MIDLLTAIMNPDSAHHFLTHDAPREGDTVRIVSPESVYHGEVGKVESAGEHLVVVRVYSVAGGVSVVEHHQVDVIRRAQ